ncbi:hypothetical protein MXB_2500 [Myxobolus squamalis]|nr:hypothetical protein MXB_2500 [Myxobolus squamalis]
MTDLNYSPAGFTIWFTVGRPSSGKTTLGNSIVGQLKSKNINAITLDGDALRKGLNRDLGFSPHSRHENIRRAAEVAILFAKSGAASIVSFISPYQKDRDIARSAHVELGIPFIEVFLNTSLEVCEKRDVKGLYKLARENVIKDMTGIQSPYEEPSNPEICLDTVEHSVDECTEIIMKYIRNNVKIFNSNQIDVISELFAPTNEKHRMEIEAESFIPVDITTVNRVDLQWVQVLAEGWAHPLKGFMNETQYLQSLHFSMIKGILFCRNIDESNMTWHTMPLPIVLSIDDDKKQTIEESGKKGIKLIFDQKTIGMMTKIQIYPHRKEERVARKFSISSTNHPVIKMIMDNGDWLIGGELTVFNKITWDDGLDQYRLTPNEIKKRIQNGHHDAVFAFQLRNPIHNGHALLLKSTHEMLKKKGYQSPVLLLHPLGGYTKDDDVPLYHRIKQHEALLKDGVLDPEQTIMAIFPSPMSYAGPTEVLWHCRARMVCGAKYYIVGRDPAGLAHPERSECDLFDPTHGAKVLLNAPLLDKLEIVPFTVVAYNKTTKTMELFDPERKNEFEFISGTKMRKLARNGEQPPEGFMAAKAWQVISDYYRLK